MDKKTYQSFRNYWQIGVPDPEHVAIVKADNFFPDAIQDDKPTRRLVEFLSSMDIPEEPRYNSRVWYVNNKGHDLYLSVPKAECDEACHGFIKNYRISEFFAEIGVAIRLERRYWRNYVVCDMSLGIIANLEDGLNAFFEELHMPTSDADREKNAEDVQKVLAFLGE